MTIVRAFLILLLPLLALPKAQAEETRTLSGTVAYRERIALPPDAKLEVALVDVSLADAPSRTIAETVVEPAGQPPIAYRITYKLSDIAAGHSYALQARIIAGGRLWFATDTRYQVLSGEVDQTDLMVVRVTGGASPVGSWLAEDIGGGGAIDRLQTTLEITADGKAFGSGGCNRYWAAHPSTGTRSPSQGLPPP